MDKRKKIGFFGGTFDPFHLGHRLLVVEMLKRGGLDELWICPTNISPFKITQPPVDIKHRIKMIELSIEGLENIFINEIEAHSKGPSYTYETLEKLKNDASHKDKEFILILSDDLLADFERWRNAQKILQEFSVLIAQTRCESIKNLTIAQWVLDKIKNRILLSSPINTSSSEVRDRLKNSLCCNHLVSLKTLDYIYKYKLYS